MHTFGIPGDSVVQSLPTNAGDTGDAGLVAGSGGAPGEGNGNPLQYSCLENSTEKPGGLHSSRGHLRVGHN